MGQNQGYSQRVVTKWSGRDSSLGSDRWRAERRTRPPIAGNVLPSLKASPLGYTQVGRVVPSERAYRKSGSKIATDDDRGNPHVVRNRRWSEEVRNPYKSYEIGF